MNDGHIVHGSAPEFEETEDVAISFNKFKFMEEGIMEFNEDLEQFVFEYNGLIFAWDEEPEEDYMEQVKTISENYNTHLNSIIEFMMPDITEVFGNFSPDEIKVKLGKPVINCDNGQVNYLEQSFDDTHIFTFEFMDNEFEDLQYFSIDG